MKKIAFIAIGLPASGKSTLFEAFAGAFEVPCISSDAIRKELFEDETDQSHNAEVFAELNKRVKAGLENGPIFIDVTNANGTHRRNLTKWCRESGAETVFGVFFDVPIMECFRRNQERERKVPFAALWKMHELLMDDPPREADGFDGIYRIH